MTPREALARHLAMIGPTDPWLSPEDHQAGFEWADQIINILQTDETRALRNFADELDAQGWAPFARWARRAADNHKETK